MNLAAFLGHFELFDSIGNEFVENSSFQPSLNHIFCELGGKTFANGLYRVFRYSDSKELTILVDRMFSENEGRFTVFAGDWSGRQFAVDNSRMIDGEPLIAMIDPGSGEIFNIDKGIIAFHNETLVSQTNDALASNFFAEWYLLHPEPITYTQCAGYIVPLFLGGEDKIDNLELSDLDVYLEICCQLWLEIQDCE